MLQNAYFLAKIGADTAENEQHVAEILPTDAQPRPRRRLALHRRRRRGPPPRAGAGARLARGGAFGRGLLGFLK